MITGYRFSRTTVLITNCPPPTGGFPHSHVPCSAPRVSNLRKGTNEGSAALHRPVPGATGTSRTAPPPSPLHKSADQRPHTTSHVLWLPPRTRTCGQHRLGVAGLSPVRQPPPQQAIQRSGSHVPGNSATPPPFPTAPYRPAGYGFHGQMPCNPVNAPSGESSDNPAVVRTTRYDNRCRNVRTSRSDPAPETATGSTLARACPADQVAGSPRRSRPCSDPTSAPSAEFARGARAAAAGVQNAVGNLLPSPAHCVGE